jgi:hypothetical protein
MYLFTFFITMLSLKNFEWACVRVAVVGGRSKNGRDVLGMGRMFWGRAYEDRVFHQKKLLSPDLILKHLQSRSP